MNNIIICTGVVFCLKPRIITEPEILGARKALIIAIQGVVNQ